MRRALIPITAVLAVALSLQAFGQVPQADKRDADSLERKISAMLARGAKPLPKTAKPLRTPVSDREVNAYFKFQGKEFLPVGVVNPNVVIIDGQHVEARATVDLDAVRKSKDRAWTDLLAYVTGTVEIRAAGKLSAANGVGTFDLESASFAGVPIAKGLLQEVISYYSRTPESPKGFSLDQPFNLPHQIRQVELQRGTAVIVQ
jgi:hypothetical protein